MTWQKDIHDFYRAASIYMHGDIPFHVEQFLQQLGDALVWPLLADGVTGLDPQTHRCTCASALPAQAVGASFMYVSKSAIVSKADRDFVTC